jgi:hypothetical protein
MDLDTGHGSNPVRIDSRHKFEPASPQEMCDAMSPDRVDSRIRQRYFQSMSSRWIAPQRGIEIFFDAMQHYASIKSL